MTAPDVIDLQVGSSRWLRASPWLVGTLGASVTLLSTVAIGLKMLLLCSLGLACAACIRAARREQAFTGLRLHTDGRAVLFAEAGAVPGTLALGGWCSRWFCVVTFVDTLGGRRFRCLLCRSRNSSDVYRRLLVRLRMGSFVDAAHGASP
jgi:hypothetical protein